MITTPTSNNSSWLTRFLRTPLGPALLLASVVLLARIAYLVWLCPYELAADEAHYWEWSRRLSLSYYTKGPGVAFLIHASTALFGITEWSVRLPAAIASFVSTILLASLAASVAPAATRPRIALLAAALFTLSPVFHGTAQFMTIDSPFFTCWVLAALITWRIHCFTPSPAHFLLLGLVIGVGMLFKYTIILLVPGILWFLLTRHPLTPLRRLLSILALLLGITICASPIIIWNSLNDWPTLAHLLGHARLPGGDITPSTEWRYNPLWTLGYLSYPFVVLGPPIGILIVLAIRKAWHQRHEDRDRWEFVSFALHSAFPILAFYLILSFKTDIELNWPVAGYTVLLLPAAWFLADQWPRSARPALWKWTLGFGLATALLISFGSWPLQWVSKIRVAGYQIPADRALKRVANHKQQAQRIAKMSRAIEQSTGHKPFIVASSYSQASLLAFYMPDHPSVRCAGSRLRGRETAYDYFADTSFTAPDILGRPSLLVGATYDAWHDALLFDRIVRSRYPGQIFAAYNYSGPSTSPR